MAQLYLQLLLITQHKMPFINASEVKRCWETEKRPANCANVQISQTVGVNWQVDIFDFSMPHLTKGGRERVVKDILTSSLPFLSCLSPPLLFLLLPFFCSSSTTKSLEQATRGKEVKKTKKIQPLQSQIWKVIFFETINWPWSNSKVSLLYIIAKRQTKISRWSTKLIVN